LSEMRLMVSPFIEIAFVAHGNSPFQRIV
jgi:hypothetical protein